MEPRTTTLEFRILGPLEVWDGERRVEIAGVKPRAVLAVLLLHANEVVGRDQLVDKLWGEGAPKTAAGSLHNHVSRLRKAIGSDVLVTQAWGYVLRIEPELIDLHRFERLVAEAEPLPARERSAGLANALSLWRGPALADLSCEPALADEAAVLDELRLTVHEARIDADLELGRSAGIITELETLISRNPLREHLRWQLILSLYRTGRQAEALEVYRQTRRLLADELGLEPSPALRELERSILCQDPSLTATHAVISPSISETGERWPRRRWLVGGLLGASVVASGVAGAVGLVRADAEPASAPPPASSTPVTIETSDGWQEPAPAKATAPTASQSPSTDTHSAPATKTPTGARGAATPPPIRPNTGGTGTTGRSGDPSPTVPQASDAASPPRGPVTSPDTAPGTTPARPDTTPTPTVTIRDDFASAPANPPFWVADTLGTGVSMSQVDGQLRMTIAPDATPDATWNAISGHYSTACAFTGDFDVSVDYTLIDWPYANSTVVALDVAFADDVVNLVRKSLPGGGQEVYAFGAPSGEYREAPTSDREGGLRMTRVDGLITAFYWDGQQWLRFASTKRAGPVRLQPTLYANGASFAHTDVAIAFDNFSVSFAAESSPCRP